MATASRCLALRHLGADELVLDVDAERGALLRIESRHDGQPLLISEVTEIAFDETFKDDVFEFTPPPGDEVRSISDQVSIQRDLTIEQAVAHLSPSVDPGADARGMGDADRVRSRERPPPDGTACTPALPHGGRHACHQHRPESPAHHPGEHRDWGTPT